MNEYDKLMEQIKILGIPFVQQTYANLIVVFTEKQTYYFDRNHDKGMEVYKTAATTWNRVKPKDWLIGGYCEI